MKHYLILVLSCYAGVLAAQTHPPTEHIFIITTDGFRWQEVYYGADPGMLGDPAFVKDPVLMRNTYADSTAAGRRKKLLPFFWNTIASEGQLYGNRSLHNKVSMSNLYRISYPGYNELLTGYPDPHLNPNLRLNNRNRNILELLNGRADYKGKVVAFGSWNVFPYIFNKKRSNIPVDCGYRHTRHDQVTFACAKDYIFKRHPLVVFLGFGETDEEAHAGHYDSYLQSATAVDGMIGELWDLVQHDPEYKDHTTFIITTDHGRGRNAETWHTHGPFTGGSGETWIACIGPGISPEGEMQQDEQIYGKQLAATVGRLLGIDFQTGHRIGDAIALPRTKPAALFVAMAAAPASPPVVAKGGEGK
ncbi:MAG: alkaline phosphatase family protein [Bacteroidota bacterium]|nr:alkaline phosphatase family protein [Bacteroidota bacterium]